MSQKDYKMQQIYSFTYLNKENCFVLKYIKYKYLFKDVTSLK